ncbi:hypothetical protein H9X90_07420 [Faecalicatena contorta]|uniref:hypothetical protein n=1 Tax=Faecalicatena contorta TaxID=39482 RepID=UPI0019605C97|nr:hypothetical protein [Faecalicatena contorta]MBM6685033.1 hypothetical protein [Faecalicatena contorta]MBM6710561.1 hypothetical protein [Faecalicatena contorta]
MKKKLKITLACVVIVILSVLYSFIDKATSVYDTDWDTSEYNSIQLYSGDSISQSFICDEEHLDGMSVKITAIGDQAHVFTEYQLIEKKTGNVVAEGVTSLEELESGKFFKIMFDQVQHCKEQEFEFVMSVSEKSGENGMIIYTTSSDNKNSFLKLNGAETEDALVCRTLTHRFDFETFFVTICFVLYIVFFMKWMYRLFK